MDEESIFNEAEEDTKLFIEDNTAEINLYNISSAECIVMLVIFSGIVLISVLYQEFPKIISEMCVKISGTNIDNIFFSTFRELKELFGYGVYK